ncbi:SDR family NAD(P)-dependent oxidoreductase [Streptomyces sp. NBC_01237]|uniref:SDR family NAD(P)-dependent oxidoreductase n=1 Tax=Streptomyces sp. NBC_01237 TaxID=2903790 RepID=UPI002DD93BA8|nr:SDR family oxidoreductase [Streptomyces sp. NBC_01237]WRZ77632.1 SDR family oxidoreductase [Streptomyces sp. NBC_01237]
MTDAGHTGGQRAATGQFAGRRIVVTGGSRGLGEHIVRLLLSEGARVATCARKPEPLEALRSSLDVPTALFTRTLDVSAPELLERFVEEAASALGGLDGVVACAGGARGRGITEATAEDWAATWELNVGHVARLIAVATPHLRAAGGGSIVVVASVSGWKPGPQAQYGSAKAAQIHMVSSLARELATDGIRVNAVSPGSMLIPGKRWDRMRREDPSAFDRFRTEFPGRELVRPEEVADAIAFLLSDQSRAVTGINLPVDKGQNAPTPEGY